MIQGEKNTPVEVEIEYNIPGLDSVGLRESLSSFIEELATSGVIDPSVSKLVIAENYVSKLEEYNSTYDFNIELSNSRGLVSASKVINIPDGSIHILINGKIINVDNLLEICIVPLIDNYQFTLVYKNSSASWPWDRLNAFETQVAHLLVHWISKYNSVEVIKQFPSLKTVPIKPHLFHEAFRITIKDAQFAHQSDLDVAKLWITIKRALELYFERLLEARAFSVFSPLNPEWDKCIGEILDEIVKLSNTDVSMRPVVDAIKNFLLFSYIRIGTEEPLEVKVSEHPKLLFPDLLNTQNSLVGFVDILGFRDIVREYDSNIISDSLRVLHFTMERALALTLQLFAGIDRAHQETLKFKQFSDCICVSTPFYDIQDHFMSEVGLLATALRVYQYLLMASNFFVRGGFAVGSYFSDDNMIFSGGLVRAYDLEQIAIYPRILLDSVVVKKIESYSQSPVVSALHLQRAFIFEEEVGEKRVFLNPFEITWALDPASAGIETSANKEIIDMLQKHLSESVGYEVALEGIMEHANSFEKLSLAAIRYYITLHIADFKNDKHKLEKYEWLIALLDFVEGKPSSRKFGYLLDGNSGVAG